MIIFGPNALVLELTAVGDDAIDIPCRAIQLKRLHELRQVSRDRLDCKRFGDLSVRKRRCDLEECPRTEGAAI